LGWGITILVTSRVWEMGTIGELKNYWVLNLKQLIQTCFHGYMENYFFVCLHLTRVRRAKEENA